MPNYKGRRHQRCIPRRFTACASLICASKLLRCLKPPAPTLRLEAGCVWGSQSAPQTCRDSARLRLTDEGNRQNATGSGRAGVVLNQPGSISMAVDLRLSAITSGLELISSPRHADGAVRANKAPIAWDPLTKRARDQDARLASDEVGLIPEGNSSSIHCAHQSSQLRRLWSRPNAMITLCMRVARAGRTSRQAGRHKTTCQQGRMVPDTFLTGEMDRDETAMPAHESERTAMDLVSSVFPSNLHPLTARTTIVDMLASPTRGHTHKTRHEWASYCGSSIGARAMSPAVPQDRPTQPISPSPSPDPPPLPGAPPAHRQDRPDCPDRPTASNPPQPTPPLPPIPPRIM